ncbi:hypothetical protein ONE63_000565 [Megalurothrips usitatus]|uniref:Uncharacterized protein n=1 Tax=Megalurothrips usitatus TaxID=439358 RepID=A0AAV7Y3S0_9NEOP|nr:hypothetical protein ONE63_000565 [Megalurothrips usitatus]
MGGQVLLAVLLEAAVLAAARAAPANPHYHFSYGVADASTGDVKTHSETRVGAAVRGSYALLEPGGTRRVVHYTADDARGFHAVVQREQGAAQGQQAARQGARSFIAGQDETGPQRFLAPGSYNDVLLAVHQPGPSPSYALTPPAAPAATVAPVAPVAPAISFSKTAQHNNQQAALLATGLPPALRLYASPAPLAFGVAAPAPAAPAPQPYATTSPTLQYATAAPTLQSYAVPALQSYATALPALQSYAPAAQTLQSYTAPALQSYAKASPALQSYAIGLPAPQPYAPAAQTLQSYAVPALHSYAAASPALQSYAPATPALQSYAPPALQQYAVAAPSALQPYDTAPAFFSHAAPYALPPPPPQPGAYSAAVPSSFSLTQVGLPAGAAGQLADGARLLSLLADPHSQ